MLLGVKTLLSTLSEKASSEKRTSIIGAYGSTFLLTVTNPMTILSFVAIFAGIGLGSTIADYGSAALLVFSVFAGSALWWLILSGSVSLLRKKVRALCYTLLLFALSLSLLYFLDSYFIHIA